MASVEQKILDLLSDALTQDKNLREKYQIGDKFRFIRDSLQQLHNEYEANLPKIIQNTEHSREIQEDEVALYVYLYNAQGMRFKSWESLLLPNVFYEHSVNRPIYTDQKQLESLIKNKSNPLQHGFIVLAVKKISILSENQDANGFTLVRVKEGSLHFNQLISFHHQGQEYVMNQAGELVKK